MMSEKRIVILREFSGLFQAKRNSEPGEDEDQESTPAATELLIGYLNNPNPTTVIAFFRPKTTQRGNKTRQVDYK